MKQLLLAGDLFPKAVSGEKLITIRKGLRDFQAGETIEIVNADDSTQVIERTLTKVSKYEQAQHVPSGKVAADGFSGYANMIELMRKFYPDFDKRTPVTVIEWQQ